MAHSQMRLVLVFGIATLLLHTLNHVQAAPVNLRLAIMAENSGRFIVANSNGTVEATAAIYDTSAQFYATFPSFNRLQLESVQESGKYLLVNDAGNVTVDYPEAENGTIYPHEWEQIFLETPIASAFKITTRDGTECYLAFMENGEIVYPCSGNITAYDEEARLRYIFV